MSASAEAEARVTRVRQQDEQYVGRWLQRHGPHRHATPLLTVRLAARRRGEQIDLATATAVALAFLGAFLWERVTGAPDGIAIFVLFIAGFAVLQLGSLVALAYLRRSDRRISTSLRQRAAPPTALSLRARLGGLFLVGAATVYGGGLLTAATALWLADDPTDRAVAVVFLIGLLASAALGAAVLADVSRRPVVADDDHALADDSALRRDDAHRAVTPFLALLALVAGVHSRSGDPLLLVYLGYAAVGAVGWVLAYVTARHAPRRAPRATGPEA